MRTVLFLVGFVVGIGGALFLLGCLVSAVLTSVAGLISVIVGQREKVKEHQRREQAFVDRRARVVADRRARVASQSL